MSGKKKSITYAVSCIASLEPQCLFDLQCASVNVLGKSQIDGLSTIMIECDEDEAIDIAMCYYISEIKNGNHNSKRTFTTVCQRNECAGLLPHNSAGF